MNLATPAGPNLAPKKKKPPMGRPFSTNSCVLTLTGFEPALCLVDHVYAAFAAHDTAIAMPAFQRAERVLDLHQSLLLARRAGASFFALSGGYGGRY